MLRLIKRITVLMALVTILFVSGLQARWVYFLKPATPAQNSMTMQMNEFSYEPEEILYIAKVEVVNVRYVEEGNYEYDHVLPTDHTTKTRVTRGGSSITYKITVHNNTDVTHWYLGPKINYSYGSNNLIVVNNGITVSTKDKLNDSSATFNTNDWVPPRTMRDFYVTYTFGNAAMGDISTYINFRFGLRIGSIQDKFLAVLNDKETDNGYYYLSEQFDEKYKEDGSTVIGNAGDEEAIFDRLFGENLTIDVNGVATPVTVMVERKNVDSRGYTGDGYDAYNGPEGCEYTVYITVDPLNSPTGKAIVYAVSYSCKNTGSAAGTWYQIGQLYEGTANIQDYDPSDGVYEGAFDVNSWIATPNNYVIDEKIQYKVGQEQGTNYDKLKTITEIMSTDDQEIYNKIDNSFVLKKAYDILVASGNSDAPEVENLRVAFEVMSPYYNVYNNGQEIKIKRDSTRAELLPYVIRLCEAIDYYSQVHE